LFYLCEAESTSCCVITLVLYVYYKERVCTRLLLRHQVEELRSIHALLLWIEIVAEKVEELLQIMTELTQSARHLVDPLIFDKCGGHKHDTVGVQPTMIGLVHVMFLQQLLHYKYNVSQVLVHECQLFYLIDGRYCETGT